MVQLTRVLARRGRGRRAVRQARGVQPGRQRQGPDRRRDDRGGRAPRAASSRGARRSSRRRRGNTGIALAFVCAAKGYDLVLTLPQGMSREREGLLRLYGARVEITESMGGMNEAVDAARAMATRDDVFLPDQFSNPANPEVAPAHDRPGDPATRSTAASTCSSPASGRAGRSPARGRCSRSATRTAGSSPSSPRRSAGALRRARPGPHKIQGIGAGLRAAGAQPRRPRRGHRRSPTRTAIETARALRARGGRARRASRAARRCGRALEVARRPESRASASSSCCRTPASATSRRRSSRRRRRELVA